jgi:hypothetical protein
MLMDISIHRKYTSGILKYVMSWILNYFSYLKGLFDHCKDSVYLFSILSIRFIASFFITLEAIRRNLHVFVNLGLQIETRDYASTNRKSFKMFPATVI